MNAVDQEGCSPLHYVTSKDNMEQASEDTPLIFKVRPSLTYTCNDVLYMYIVHVHVRTLYMYMYI